MHAEVRTTNFKWTEDDEIKLTDYRSNCTVLYVCICVCVYVCICVRALCMCVCKREKEKTKRRVHATKQITRRNSTHTNTHMRNQNTNSCIRACAVSNHLLSIRYFVIISSVFYRPVPLSFDFDFEFCILYFNF